MRPSIPGSEKSTHPSLAEYLLEPSRDLNAQRLCFSPDSRFSKKQWRFVFLPQALKISLPRHVPSGAGVQSEKLTLASVKPCARIVNSLWLKPSIHISRLIPSSLSRSSSCNDSTDFPKVCGAGLFLARLAPVLS